MVRPLLRFLVFAAREVIGERLSAACDDSRLVLFRLRLVDKLVLLVGLLFRVKPMGLVLDIGRRRRTRQTGKRESPAYPR
jgi:hypothetical protein